MTGCFHNRKEQPIKQIFQINTLKLSHNVIFNLLQIFSGNAAQVAEKRGTPFPHTESVPDVQSFGMIRNVHAAGYGHPLTIGIMKMCHSYN
jgi:hypothetical protein